MNEQILEVAMEIILNSGNARNSIKEATDAFINKDFDNIEIHLNIAQEFLRKAHVIQTQVIQEEARGVKHELSLLFIHAQDTLMTVMSEFNLTNNFIRMLKSVQLKEDENESK